MKNFTSFGFGALKSDQVLIRHKEIIDAVKEVIARVGCNEIPTKSSKEITNNIDDTVQKLKEMNNEISYLPQRRPDQSKQEIIETNEALKKYCTCRGMNVLSHGNIAKGAGATGAAWEQRSAFFKN